MLRLFLFPLCLIAALGLSACKIVKTAPGAGAAASDETIIADILGKTWEAQLLPLLTGKANDLGTLRSAVSSGLDAAGKAMGNRGAGDGGAWAFAVQGQGVVVAANLQSRARKAELDTDGDGKADLTLQLGPVIKGTALRDVAPFYIFTEFRDQIQFALLARALNDRATAGLTLPEGDLVGRKLAFSGAVSLRTAADPWLVTIVTLKALP